MNIFLRGPKTKGPQRERTRRQDGVKGIDFLKSPREAPEAEANNQPILFASQEVSQALGAREATEGAS